MGRIRFLLAAGGLLALSGCGQSQAPAQQAGSGEGWVLKAQTVLPPGQSGFFSVAGQAQGLLTGNPADYGPHVDDQRPLYWSFGTKSGIDQKSGTPESPREGVQIYRDAYGVPSVYASTVRDLWFGVGYAVAQDRLFLMDAVRRESEGTMSELTGCGSIPADIQQRTLSYTDAEYQTFFDRLSPDARDAVLGYVDGANAWRTQAISDPTKLPAEYALLTTTPAPFTVKDVLAAGVYITRFVASEGGNEFENIRLLKLLQQQYGSRSEAIKAFQDLDWLEDPRAVTTIPRGDGVFSNQAMPASGRDAVLAQMADWAMTLPDTLWKGDGTGNAALPQPCSTLASVASLSRGGAGEVTRPKRHQAVASLGVKLRLEKDRIVRIAAVTHQVVQALLDLRRHFHGGSHAYAIGSTRTRDHGTLLVSGPQLGYSYPTLLVEYGIHGAGYDAHGVSVPLLPVVGIGYSNDVAWGLTTGYSKTIDSFIETICSTTQQAAGTCSANQYLHDGQWLDMDCRNETFNFRVSAKGIPVGTPSLSQVRQICRTVHGPVVARDDAAGLARTVQYAMWQHEIDTIEGIREWNKAHTFTDFVDGVKKVTWNENVIVATRDGHIAYFHPGSFPRRSADTDMRLPAPGTGAYDFGANLPFDELPHDIDPPQGFIANWNTKPAYGWLDGEGLGYSSRPGGPGQRVTNILDLLATRSDWSFADLKAVDTHVGTTDERARNYLPVIQSFRNTAASRLSDVQKAALDLMLNWDHSHYGPDIDINDASAHDGPAATVFGEYVSALRDQLFAPLKSLVVDGQSTAFDRITDVGSHVFDMSVADNVALRVLEPASSGLTMQHDFTGGRDRDTLMLDALNEALAQMATEYNGGAPLTVADLPKCMRVHPRSQICSLSGVIGPGSSTIPGTQCVSMPYQDRGSWVHRVGYEQP